MSEPTFFQRKSVRIAIAVIVVCVVSTLVPELPEHPERTGSPLTLDFVTIDLQGGQLQIPNGSQAGYLIFDSPWPPGLLRAMADPSFDRCVCQAKALVDEIVVEDHGRASAQLTIRFERDLSSVGACRSQHEALGFVDVDAEGDGEDEATRRWTIVGSWSDTPRSPARPISLRVFRGYQWQTVLTEQAVPVERNRWLNRLLRPLHAIKHLMFILMLMVMFAIGG